MQRLDRLRLDFCELHCVEMASIDDGEAMDVDNE